MAYLMVLAMMVSAAKAWAEDPANVSDYQHCAPDGIALGGNDPVSYYQENGPKRGNQKLTVQHGKLTYQFVSQDNLTASVAEPTRYLPTYLGWCSTNLAMGRLACPDFDNFQIEDGRLLLFEHAGFTNGRDVWNSNPNQFRLQADNNFDKFSQ